ncbi:hypothetical protein GCM10009039_00640 [Halocalculus aciditolerans]|uniref:Uncharacterized protein n=1 Tax=Halocalculus aciditolerans TaxID=1383812 RepID=A0A830F6N4_9EURY|nr:hypothetical protein GCM10009039_00640 [Halocalculus aciditolerans]
MRRAEDRGRDRLPVGPVSRDIGGTGSEPFRPTSGLEVDPAYPRDVLVRIPADGGRFDAVSFVDGRAFRVERLSEN